MNKVEILFLVAVVEVGELCNLTMEELSEIWSALTVCRDSEEFFAQFDKVEQGAIIVSIKKVEAEMKRRHAQPINFFRLMKEDPAKVEFYLKQFSTDQLLGFERDLQEFANNEIVDDLLKLVRKQIYRRVPVC